MARPRSAKKHRRENQAAVNRWLAQGWRALQEENFGQAIRYFQRVTRQASTNFDGWYGYGLALSLLGRTDEARKALRKALALDPDHVEAWHALALAADHEGLALEALEAIRKTLTLAKAQGCDDDIIRGIKVSQRGIELGVRRLMEAMGTEDEETLQRALALYDEGVEAFERGDYAQAAEKFQELVDVTPRSPRGWANLGAALLMAGQLDKAEDALQRAQAIDPTYEPARHNLALVEKARQNPDQPLNVLVHEYTETQHGAPRRRLRK